MFFDDEQPMGGMTDGGTSSDETTEEGTEKTAGDEESQQM